MDDYVDDDDAVTEETYGAYEERTLIIAHFPPPSLSSFLPLHSFMI